MWAHPYWDVTDPRHADAVRRLRHRRRRGLLRLLHTEEQTIALYNAARELGLLTTGSTDFHGPAHEHFNRFRGFDLYGLEPDLGRLVQ